MAARQNLSLTRLRFIVAVSFAIVLVNESIAISADSRYATADSRGRYVHNIDLLDANYRKIDPTSESAQPYSPLKTCGKCHDYETISHGWHFNAMTSSESGRPGEPWIWSDERTGTHLPLSYRDWLGTFRPQQIGISPFQMSVKFGSHFPGGGPGTPPEDVDDSEQASETDEGEAAYDRFQLSGELSIDCMMCHSNDRSYSPADRMEQIEDENFTWAATVAVGLATVKNRVRSIRDGSDPKSDEVKAKLPELTYDSSRFRPDGTVFFDVRRVPSNESCYHCHSVMQVGNGARWTHDGDVHLRAGMACVDCHRNGIDHQTVRGYEGEQHSSESVTTLSCRGCHLGEADTAGKHHAFAGGRLGSPKPLHKGIPPLHFEKMACTACHSGPIPDQNLTRLMTSKAHRLGAKEHRGDQPAPGVVAPVFLRVSDDGTPSTEAGIYTPHSMMWPSFWATIREGRIEPLNPEEVYDVTRRALGIRSDFDVEMRKIRLSSKDKAAVLGDERGTVKEEEWTDEEKQKIEAKIAEMADAQTKEKMTEALVALRDSDETLAPVYLSGGKAWTLSGDDDQMTEVTDEALLESASPYAWPLGHDVRPARWSLGVTGCLECHSDGSPMFYGEVAAIGTLPDPEPVTRAMHELQGSPPEQLSAWNQMFAGRSSFKIASYIALCLVLLIVLAYIQTMVAGSLNRLGGWLLRPKTPTE